MPTRNTPRTTRRTQTSSRSDRRPSTQPVAQSAYSSESGRTYRLDRLIGKGGFGEVYLATPTPGSGIPAQVCVKISDRISGWLREAYFAELLGRQDRALRVFDRFAEMVDGQMRYCLAIEYAEHGDLGVWLGGNGAQSERFVRREIAAILGALDALHRGQAMHRDLTPFNVFVCPGKATDVLVRGQPSAQQIAGKDAGSKLIEVRRLAAQGHKVTVIGERQFCVSPNRPRDRPRRRELEHPMRVDHDGEAALP